MSSERLNEIAHLASKAGLSYGQYMVLHGGEPVSKGNPDPSRRLCLNCGKPIYGRQIKFCDACCRKSYNNRLSNQKRKERANAL